MLSNSPLRISSIYIMYFSVADLLMVIYLTVIGYHDKIYQNRYYLYAHEWESSNLCTAIGITAVISSEVFAKILIKFYHISPFILICSNIQYLDTVIWDEYDWKGAGTKLKYLYYLQLSTD